MPVKKTLKNRLTLSDKTMKENPDVNLDAPLSSIREKMKKIFIGESDVIKAVAWARKRKWTRPNL